MKVHLSADHAGLDLKNFLLKALDKEGYDVIDEGPYSLDPKDDYPETTKETILKVKGEDVRGILVCRNGVGVMIFANRFKGVRAGLSWNPKHAISHRTDDNTNILTLPSDYISKKSALKIAKAWLETEFHGEERHIRRLGQVEKYSE